MLPVCFSSYQERLATVDWENSDKDTVVRSGKLKSAEVETELTVSSRKCYFRSMISFKSKCFFGLLVYFMNLLR